MVCDTPSHGSDHLCLIWKETIHNCRWYRADTACGTDGRTDGQTDGRSETSNPPPQQQLRCAGGIIISIGLHETGKLDAFYFWQSIEFYWKQTPIRDISLQNLCSIYIAFRFKQTVMHHNMNSYMFRKYYMIIPHINRITQRAAMIISPRSYANVWLPEYNNVA